MQAYKSQQELNIIPAKSAILYKMECDIHFEKGTDPRSIGLSPHVAEEGVIFSTHDN